MVAGKSFLDAMKSHTLKFLDSMKCQTVNLPNGLVINSTVLKRKNPPENWRRGCFARFHVPFHFRWRSVDDLCDWWCSGFLQAT